LLFGAIHNGLWLLQIFAPGHIAWPIIRCFCTEDGMPETGCTSTIPY
jgi:hypothetical protein